MKEPKPNIKDEENKMNSSSFLLFEKIILLCYNDNRGNVDDRV